MFLFEQNMLWKMSGLPAVLIFAEASRIWGQFYVSTNF